MDFRSLIPIFLLVANVSVQAKVKQSTLLKDVEAHYRGAQTIKMDVIKVIKLKLMEREKTSDGIIQIKKGGKLRWETQKPEHSLVLADGKVIWLVDYPAEAEEKIHVIKATNPVKSQPHALVAFLLGQGRISDDFAVISEEPSRDGAFQLELKPRENIDQVQWLTLLIDKESRSIQKLAFEDAIGNVTELYFKNIEFDKTLAKDTFRFKLPKGAELTVIN